ncbi:GAP family protein [Actinomadura verrucosospora]|uniref:Membrane protein n=1 Tax=Actinomadura verrucosospora TaxID=46165 RepID=A0A7D3W1X8_ACTVE|nr:GAP family protein [Actinomadura verrucosospora]QKG27178.1 membrane protein [Actinomadura verrucosospora]
MGFRGALGDLLPPAVGVALSPVPIIAVVVMLMAPAARTAPVFALGWLFGLLAATAIIVIVADPAGADTDSGTTWTAVVKISLGVLFLLMAAKQWRSRPRDGAEPQMPGWMAAVDRMAPAKAFGLGALLSGLNPKNLALAVAAALAIAQAGLTTGGGIAAVLIFVILGSLTVAGPVLAALLFRDRVRPSLLAAKDWLIANNATVMFVVLLILGTVMLGKGIARL